MNTPVKALDKMFDWIQFNSAAGKLVERLAKHNGSAIVSTAQLTVEQIEIARNFRRLIVDPDGKGYALMHHWNPTRARLVAFGTLAGPDQWYAERPEAITDSSAESIKEM